MNRLTKGVVDVPATERSATGPTPAARRLPSPVDLALSPYHLTTRDPAALAALLLGESVVTILPTPPTGITREDVALALRRSPPYGRFLESWRWALPLFKSGLINSLHQQADAIEDSRQTCQRVAEQAEWTKLRPFFRPGAFSIPEGYLDGVSTDILKGGPDPGWSVPIVAGLDALAVRCGLLAVRAGGGRPGAARGGGRGDARDWRGSTAQQAEWRLGEQCFAVAIPVLTQAGAGTIMEAREALARPLQDLRSAMDGCFGAQAGDAGAGAKAAGKAASDRVRAAARAYGAAFDEFIADRGGHGQDDDEGHQVLDAFVRVSGVRLPADAAALAALVATSQLRAGKPGPVRAAAVDVPVPSRPLRALVIEPMTLDPRERPE